MRRSLLLAAILWVPCVLHASRVAGPGVTLQTATATNAPSPVTSAPTPARPRRVQVRFVLRPPPPRPDSLPVVTLEGSQALIRLRPSGWNTRPVPLRIMLPTPNVEICYARGCPYP